MKEIIRRYALFIICLFFMGIGVALTKHGELGVSPISSVANVVSIKYTFFSFGTWLTISNCVLLLGQILLLRRNFKPVQLLQIPLSFLFGYFTDFGLWLVSGIPNDRYVVQLLLVIVGIVVLYYYLIESFKKINEDNLMQSKLGDDGGLAPTKEADDAMRKLDRLELNISIK